MYAIRSYYVLVVALIIFAAHAVMRIVARIRRGETRALMPAGVVLVVMLIISNGGFIKGEENPTASFVQMGNMYWNDNNFEKAEEMYLEGLKIDPDNPRTDINVQANVSYNFV